jgi:hypothetical protein
MRKAIREPRALQLRITGMKTGAALLLVGLVGLGIASPTETAASRERAAKPPATVLAWRWVNRRGVELVRLDRRSLGIASKRRVLVGKSTSAWARSPDGKRIAVGVDEALGIRIVDAIKMRRAGAVGTRNGQVRAMAWLTPNRIVGAEETGIFVVDPVARRLVSARATEGQVFGATRTANALVLLLAPDDGIGRARLATLSADGAYRTVELREISAGFRYPTQTDEPPGERRNPGLAVDPAGERAFVVGAGEPVAEVDLRSLAVSYHEPARPISLFGRLRNWLEPKAEAKGPVLGSTRKVLWLGNGRLAITGEDGRPGRDGVVVHPAGLSLIDTRSWSVETVQRDATSATTAGGTLVAWVSGPELQAIGLRGYDLDGDERFHLFGSRGAAVLERLDERVFVDDGAVTYAVDARAGRIVRVVSQVPQLLVGSMQRY